MLPDIFTQRLKLLYPDRVEEIVASFRAVRRVSFRVNTLLVAEPLCIDELRSLGFDVEGVPLIPRAYILNNKTKRELTETDAYKKGFIYIQSLSSMVPVALLAENLEVTDSSALRVLDLCAAPGSKTTQLADVMHNKGEIISNDSSRDRLFILKRALGMYGVKNVTPTLGHGEHIWKKYGPVFDVVLLDAPCSGEGRWRLDTPGGEDDPSLLDWSLQKVARLAHLQVQLIFAAVMCLRPGGTLIYSTCTLAPEENEAIVDFALKKFEGAIDVANVPLADNFVRGVGGWGDTVFDSRVSRSVRILPNDMWEGFFVCKIVRN